MDLSFWGEFIQPELLAAVPALCFFGTLLKRSPAVDDHKIPLLLGIAGILIASVWTLGQTTPRGLTAVMNALFTAVVQGLLCAGASVYLHQLVHQRHKRQKERAQPAAPTPSP